jgi:hypothetical protein
MKAFIYCSGLTSVNLSNGLTSLGVSAFNGCKSLTSICIPESVTIIDNGAFYDCSGLTDVFCLAENVPATKSDAFELSPISLGTLHVPADAVEEYRKRRPWNGFGSIVALGKDDVIGDDGTGTISPVGETKDEGVYDISGRKMVNGKLPRGIYIEDGKKKVK